VGIAALPEHAETIARAAKTRAARLFEPVIG